MTITVKLSKPGRIDFKKAGKFYNSGTAAETGTPVNNDERSDSPFDSLDVEADQEVVINGELIRAIEY